MSVAHDDASSVTEVHCYRGGCFVENSLGSQLLTEQQKITMTIDTPPTLAETMTEEDKETLEVLPEAKSGEDPIPPLRAESSTPSDT